MTRKIIISRTGEVPGYKDVADADLVLQELGNGGWSITKSRMNNDYEIITARSGWFANAHNKSLIPLEIPPGTTMGDIMTVEGALADVATGFIDWEKLHNHDADAISSPGILLLALVKALKDHVDG